ncbi:MAG: 4-hydroxy-2-oxoheptanedioate aldolase [Burkholderiaceae bacterium]|nr:4-hydroxy-2-oxoheptanedioate aldolase [Burkholderiaceae bacterium]
MNPFKTAIARGEHQIGLWLSLAHAYSAEVCATAGFDWLLIDGEHAPNDIPGTLAQLQALAAYRSHPVVRVVQGDAALVKQMMDIGVQTLLVPMVDTAQQARAMVAATRYPPQGMRGVAASIARASRWGAQADYLDRANDEACLLVQAESATALANLDEICAVDGVDGVFIGPADLAASMGHRGHPNHPEVQAAIDDAVRRITAHGKAAGTLTSDPAMARHYLGLGATFVAVGVDLSLLAQATRRLARDFGLGALAAASTGGPY